MTKVPDTEKEMDMEMIHLRISTLHILGAYLDTSPTVGHAALVQARLEDKTEEIKAMGEECLLIGDLNGPIDKPTELPKTRLMQTWFDSGKVELLNDPKVHTRFCPVTGKGSALDLAVITPGLRNSVEQFKLDKNRKWSLHGTVKNKTTRRLSIGSWSDHQTRK